MLTRRHDATAPAEPQTGGRGLAQQEPLDQCRHIHAQGLHALGKHGKRVGPGVLLAAINTSKLRMHRRNRN